MTVQSLEIAGQRMVLLTQAEFERLQEAAENYADIEAAVDARQRREAGEEYFPAELVDRLLEGQNPLKVWREYRGLTQARLGEVVGCQSSMISKLEKGRLEGGVKLWQALAKALSVDLDDLIET